MTAGPPRYPDLSAWVPLDRDHVRTAYLERKAARLVVAERVTFLDGWGSAVSFPFQVHGDGGGVYVCWVQPYRPDTWWATCSRGGDHDRTPARAACAHMLAAAVELALHVRPHLGTDLEHEPSRADGGSVPPARAATSPGGSP